MAILKHIVGIASELFIFKNPYDEAYVPPRLISETRDGCGHVVQQTIRAQNHRDATEHLQGSTIQGNRSIVATKTSKHTWKISVEDWNTRLPQKRDE